MARSNRNPSGGAARNTAQIDHNLRAATSSARSLAFATAGVTGQLNGAVGASAVIAENIAKVSTNAKIAASATGIGAVVAILGTIAAFTINWKKETEEVATKIRGIVNATAQLEAQAKGNKRLERELEIQGAMEDELDAAEKMDHFYRKFPELQDAIRRKAQAARDAVSADSRPSIRVLRRRALTDQINPKSSQISQARRERDVREYELQSSSDSRHRPGSIKEKLQNGYTDKQFDAIYKQIDDVYQAGDG
jgi:hypothetical protein